MTEENRRKVTYAQLESLWEILIANKSLATGFNKTTQAREYCRRMWENAAGTLNAHGSGAVKDWKGWCKYWNDYKCKLKSRVAALRSSHRQTGGGPATVKELTDIEKKFLGILGDDFGMGIAGARVEPFLASQPSTSHEEMTSPPEGTGEVILREIYFERDPSTPCHIEHPTTDIVSPLSSWVLPGSAQSSPRARPHLGSPRRSPRLLSRTPAAAPAQQTHGLHTGAAATSGVQRRRTRRRELPMTQEEARRTLIRMSQQRAETCENILRELVSVIRDIRDILNERLPRQINE